MKYVLKCVCVVIALLALTLDSNLNTVECIEIIEGPKICCVLVSTTYHCFIHFIIYSL